MGKADKIYKLSGAKVKASTLIEVIIAMVIILVVFALAMGIYTNVLRTTSSIRGEQIKAMTSQLLEQSVSNKDWNDLDSLQDSMLLQKKVLSYRAFLTSAAERYSEQEFLDSSIAAVAEKENDYADLVVITVTAFEHGKQMGQARRILKKVGDGN